MGDAARQAADRVHLLRLTELLFQVRVRVGGRAPGLALAATRRRSAFSLIRRLPGAGVLMPAAPTGAQPLKSSGTLGSSPIARAPIA